MAVETDQGRCGSDPRARGRGRACVLQVITKVGLGWEGDPKLMGQESAQWGFHRVQDTGGPQASPYEEETFGGALITKPAAG